VRSSGRFCIDNGMPPRPMGATASFVWPIDRCMLAV
jgi:hypothetical protein